MKKLGKIFKIIGINLIVFIVLLELIAVAIYFFKNQSLFYTDKHGRKIQGTGRSDVDTDIYAGLQPTQLTNKRFHPFFGYTYKENLKNTNNYGFNCPYDYPLEKEKKNWYIIGVFGGSVADNFYREGTERLTEKLKRHAYFADKEIIYLNYAIGGYKQPQQMQILTYFLSIGQQWDIVINIDGFNEIIFCFNNNRLNVDIAMPSGQHFLPMRDLMESQVLTDEKLQSIWKIRQYKGDLKRIQGTIAHTPFASIYLVLSAYNNHLYKKYNHEILRFDGLIKPAKVKDSIINIKYTPALRDEHLLLSKVTSLWSRCSTVMSRALAAQNGEGRYFHFLQPNQYYSNKIFTREEQKIALDHQGTYSYLVKKGYPVLRQEIEVLRKNNVNAFSGVEIFDKVKETVYIDNCCHFNRWGNRIFADFIAKSIWEVHNHEK
ncbi:MAG: hypothetical protein PVH61_00790 [Candidatus Aminicenantes bacterium]|jgi:hypothetical protein